MTLSKRGTFILIGSILALALAMCLIFLPSLRAAVLRPLVDTWISFRYALAIISERVQWSLAIAIALTVSLLSLLKRMPRDRPAKPSAAGAKPPRQGPLMRISDVLGRARRSRFAREQAMLELRDLTAHVLAFRNGISVLEAKAQIDKGTWTQDATVRDLFVRSLDKRRLRSGQDFHADAEEIMSMIEKFYQEV